MSVYLFVSSNNKTIKMLCRICNSSSSQYYKDTRVFHKCPQCSLIFTDQTLDRESEEKHYKGQWENSNKEHIIALADKLITIINKYRKPSRILDFGSGSGSITDEFLSRGIDTTPYEPMAHGSLAKHNYQNKFDTVIATEVIEHLPNLWDELKNIMGVLTNDGIAVFTTLMTNAFIDTPNEQFAFRKWWYKDDLTHVSFFCNRSLAKLAELGHFKIDVYGDNNSSNTVVIYKNKIV